MPKEAKPKRKTAEKSETKAKKAAASKDKGPKRPLSAFMYFCKDWRERVKAENPSASFGEVGKLLGAKWKELDEADKTSYLEEAAKDKARYDAEKESGEGGGGASKKTKKVKDDSASADDDDDDD
ncbi:Non-histone chromosomal protein 6 [Tulasnella sp. 418]|nr:Non-histone chromosomal protein 6 [Tulasnella sp. 418]